METSVLSLKNVTKTFGKHRGVSELNLSIEKGTVVGFLGPNGAGKSTTMNMLIGLTSPTSGTAKIFNTEVTVQNDQLRKNIGFLASDTALDGGLTGAQQLTYFAHIRGMHDLSHGWDIAKRLNTQLDKPIKKLSRGNRQKVALVAALMHKPELLILDEPTSGLDPLMQAAFNDIIREHRAAGGTTFISSHVLSEIEELCDKLIFIREGKIISQTTQAELRAAAPKQVAIVSSDVNLGSALLKVDGVKNMQQTETTITFSFGGKMPALLKVLATHTVVDLTITEHDLEESFMQFYGEGNTQ